MKKSKKNQKKLKN